ncbi:MAG: tellurite resistance TerB family protein [Acetobacteraceae bacterium]|nr:tellurite resistance TerB family protein [Acetobacteraceae bacterium]
MEMTPPGPARLNRFTPQEALICAMVMMSAVDGSMTDAELKRMTRLVGDLPVFAGAGPAEVERVTDVCLKLLEDAEGLDRGIAMIAAALPPRLRETAYLLACDVASANGEANQDELRFLQDLRIGLDLDRLVAGAIERAARARFQVV